MTKEGFVREAFGSGTMSASSPYFLRSSSIGPNSIARCGQDSTQIGCSPSFRRSRQPSHFDIRFVAGLKTGA